MNAQYNELIYHKLDSKHLIYTDLTIQTLCVVNAEKRKLHSVIDYEPFL